MLQTQETNVNPHSTPSSHTELNEHILELEGVTLHPGGPGFDLQARMELAVSAAIRRVLEQSDLADCLASAAELVVSGMRPHELDEHALWNPATCDESEAPLPAVHGVTRCGLGHVLDLRAAAAAGVEYAFCQGLETIAERAIYEAIQARLQRR